mgnify:CR=1 FL=1
MKSMNKNLNKHAYVITTYGNAYTLKELLKQIDDERNDVFVHIDKKSPLNQVLFSTSKSKLTFIESKKVYWGDYSMINAVLRLFEAAVNTDEYSYIHLLSGQDLCIKSQDEIHEFFNDNNDKLYFHINVGTFRQIQDRCRYYYPFINTKHFKYWKWLKALSLVLGKAQKFIGINRLRHSPIYPIYNGWDWYSITGDFAKYVLTQEPLIRKTFHHTLSNDECFVHTIAMHSPKFRDKVYGYNGKDDAMDASKRLQDWKRGKPYTFTFEDFDMIISSPYYFARKFDDKNIELVKKIVEFTIN